VQEGINLFTVDEYERALENFSKAVLLEPNNYISYYYLGLINYSKENFLEAESYYQQALSLGAEESITKYAIGVNFFANNQYDQATMYLLEAKTSDPENYSEKVDTLLLRINTR
jgi:tetratricopeptide (TPR) repeat protein